jgi:hypothetical protein
MTTNIYELFKDHIELPADYTECLWYVRYDQVTWTEGDELSDLFNGDGDTYSCEVKEMGKEIGGYIIYTLRDGWGGEYQAIFKMSKEQDEDKYWESLEEGEEL